VAISEASVAVCGAELVTREEGVLPCQDDREDLVLDRVSVELEPSVFEEAREPWPDAEASLLGPLLVEFA